MLLDYGFCEYYSTIFLVVYSTTMKKRLIRESRRTIFDHSADKVLLYFAVHGNFISNIGIRATVIVLVIH
jgi:hypothetical protein